MIIPDVNLLLYTYTERAQQHSAARVWFEKLMTGPEEVGLPWMVVLAFIRLATNQRVMHPPASPDEAISVVRSWLESGTARILQPGPGHGEILFRLLSDAGVAGNLTTDAHIAALGIEYQAVVHTTDADFVRFSGCRWLNPLERKS